MAPTFNIIRKDRSSVNYGGGVLIAVNNSFYSEELIINSGDNTEICCAVVNTKINKLFFICCYIPPNSSSDIYNLHCHGFQQVSHHMGPNDRLIIMGDFNLPAVKWSFDETNLNSLLPHSNCIDAMNFLSEVASLCTIQINFVKNFKNNLLDLIFLDNTIDFRLSRCTPTVLPEDQYHPTLELQLDIGTKASVNSKNSSCKVFLFKKCNLDNLNQLLESTEWHSLFPVTLSTESDLDKAIDNFYSIVLGYLETTVPKVTAQYCSGPKWFTVALRKNRNIKSKLYKKAKKTGLLSDYSKYLLARYHYQRLCKIEYKKYLSKTAINLRKCPKLFWNFVNSKRKSCAYPSCMAYNGVYSTSHSSSGHSELFADFFNAVYSTFEYIPNSYPFYIQQHDIPYPKVSRDSVEIAAKSIKSSFKSGPDMIPSFILRECACALSLPLNLLFNHSLRLGYFPAKWKSSYIVPLHKCGMKSQVENYRGIAKLSAIPKLFESIICNQLTFELQRIISPAQHGFLSGKSTITNLLEFTTKVFLSYGKSLQTDVIYTDFSKAFDTLNHRLLLMKLKSYGFPEVLLRWFQSYLCGRTQYVVFNDCYSRAINVTSGVPQGSHLGPILFLLYINDLVQVIENASILLYADDVKLFYSSNFPNNMLQLDLNNLVSWCNLNGMKLNIKKCKHMTFARKSLFHSVYSISNCPLETVTNINDLGILMDSKLRFDLHVGRIINKANGVLGFIKRWSKEFNDPYISKKLFSGLVRPILEYGSVIWNPGFMCDISRIESVQKQFLLFCLRSLDWGSTYQLPPYVNRLKLIHLPTLESRRTTLDVLFILKIIKGDINSPFLLSQFSIKIPLRLPRSYQLLSIPMFKSTYLNNFAFVLACKKFNEYYNLIDFNKPYNVIKDSLIEFMNNIR